MVFVLVYVLVSAIISIRQRKLVPLLFVVFLVSCDFKRSVSLLMMP